MKKTKLCWSDYKRQHPSPEGVDVVEYHGELFEQWMAEYDPLPTVNPPVVQVSVCLLLIMALIVLIKIWG